MSRTEILLELSYAEQKTPSRDELKKKIAADLKADEKLIVVKKISPSFGVTKTTAAIYQYKTEEDLKKIEPKPKEKKKPQEKETPKEESPK